MHLHVVSYLALALVLWPGAAMAAQTSQVTGQVRLVPAIDLVGRTVVSREAERIGSLEFVTVDLDKGNLSHLVVDTSGSAISPDNAQSDQELLIVPWSAVEIGRDRQKVTILATGYHIANAPRLARNELQQLAEPTVATYVVDYWKPASELAALESQRSKGGERSPQNPPSDAGSDPSAASGGAGTNERQAAREQLRSGTAGGQARDETGSPTVLVGQEVVTSVAPPMFQLGRDLQGAKVTDQKGTPMGEIRQIMIDADTGHAAFAVLERPSADPAPVPLQTLEWTAEGTTMLMASASALQPDSALTNPSGQVSRQQLARLYRRFGVPPYWNGTADSGRTGAESSTPETPR